jgi:hypothetical protein
LWLSAFGGSNPPPRMFIDSNSPRRPSVRGNPHEVFARVFESSSPHSKPFLEERVPLAPKDYYRSLWLLFLLPAWQTLYLKIFKVSNAVYVMDGDGKIGEGVETVGPKRVSHGHSVGLGGKFLEKIGFGGTLEPVSRRKRRKVFAISASGLIVVLIVVLFLWQGGITGNVVQEEEVSGEEENLVQEPDELTVFAVELAAKEQELAEKNSELESVRSQISSKDDKISELEKTLSEKVDELEEVENLEGNFSEELSRLKEENEELVEKQEEVKDIVRSTVRSYCCSVHDIQTGSSLEWDLVDGQILCQGQYKINCGTGVVDYFSRV